MSNRRADMTFAIALLIALLLCVAILVALTALSNHIGKALGAAFEKQFSNLLSDVFRRLAIEVAETTASFDRRCDAHAFVRQRQNDLEIVFTQDGNQVVVDRLPPTVLGVVRLSPDGRQLAFLTVISPSDKSFKEGLYMYDIQSRRRRQVWTGAGTNPLFSPDRRYLILNTSDGVQVIDVQTKRAHKSWAKRVLSENFSPRNELVVETDSARRFVVVWDALKRSQPPSSGQTPAPLSGIFSEAASLAWSADGQWIAYTVIPNADREELWLMHTKRADKRLVHKASGIGNLRWSDDSQELFFVEVENVANESASVRWMKYRIAGKRCVEVKW